MAILDPRADAPICGHMLEYCCNEERNVLYRPDGHCHGEMRFTPPQPQRMHWDLPPLVSELTGECVFLNP